MAEKPSNPSPAGAPGNDGVSPARTLTVTVLVLAVWSGINTVWGLTGAPTALSDHQAALVPLSVWMTGAFGVLAAIIAIAAVRREPRVLVPGLMGLAYVGGAFLSEHGRAWLAPDGAVIDRIFFALPILFMLAVWLAFPRWRDVYPLRPGNPAPPALKPPAARRAATVFVYAFLAAAFAVFLLRLLIEAGVLAAGWWPDLGTTAALSALNGFSEEMMFRALFLPAFALAIGPRPAVWAQAVLFAIVHLGASASLMGSAPSALILFLLGLYFGTSVLKQNGLAWVVTLHIAIDIVGLSAWKAGIL